MREEVIMQAVNDIDTIARLTDDLHEQHFTNEPDYWTKLHHQAAIAAMQGILSCDDIKLDFTEHTEEVIDAVANTATKLATTLVNKLKEEQK